MKKGKQKRILISIILAVLVISADLVVLIYNEEPKDKVFIANNLKMAEKLNIIDIKSDYNKYYLKYNEIEDANKYVVEVLSQDKVIYNKESDKETLELEIPLEYLNNGNEYYLNLSAYKNDNLLLKSEEVEAIVWNEPSFNKENKTSINNKSYSIKIDGKLNKDYRLVIKNGNKVLYDKVITTNTFKVPSNLYNNKNIKLDFMLYYKKQLISTFRATNKYVKPTTTTTKEKNPIKDIKIKTPASYLSLKEIKNVEVEFTGGENSEGKNIYIYENDKLIKKDELTENKYTITADLLKAEKSYKVVVEAINGKFKKSSSIYISTIKDGAKKMVELARTQIGVKKGLKYSKWYGFNGRVEWCAVFISWLANENGLLKNVIPKFAGVGVGWRWFNSRGLTVRANKKYVPKTGDIVFFDFNNDGRIDHVGLVDYSDGKNVYTIEGNSKGDECRDNKYPINYHGFYGFASPRY